MSGDGNRRNAEPRSGFYGIDLHAIATFFPHNCDQPVKRRRQPLCGVEAIHPGFHRVRQEEERHCHVGWLLTDAMLDECRTTPTAVTGSRGKSSRNASGTTFVS